VYKFIRNFKILFIKGDEFLFRNRNLRFLLDRDTDIQMKISDFIKEVAGIMASGGVKDKNGRMSMIKQKLTENYDKDDNELGFTDIGEIVGSRYYKPSITDMKMLNNTK
jgi:hypothetical protein